MTVIIMTMMIKMMMMTMMKCVDDYNNDDDNKMNMKYVYNGVAPKACLIQSSWCTNDN